MNAQESVKRELELSAYFLQVLYGVVHDLETTEYELPREYEQCQSTDTFLQETFLHPEIVKK